MFSLTLCSNDQIGLLMKFIGENWKSQHILGNDIQFMNWHYFSKKYNRYNFVLATSDSEIIGCHGFIPHSHYSEGLNSNDTVWMVNCLALPGESGATDTFDNQIVVRQHIHDPNGKP